MLELLFAARYNKWRLRLALLLYAAILVLGSVPGARADLGELASGLLLHSVAYAGLSYLLFAGADGARGRRAARAVLGVMAMGALDEFVQSFLPYRHGSLGDWLVDSNAALLAAAVLWAGWTRLNARLGTHA